MKNEIISVGNDPHLPTTCNCSILVVTIKGGIEELQRRNCRTEKGRQLIIRCWLLLQVVQEHDQKTIFSAGTGVGTGTDCSSI